MWAYTGQGEGRVVVWVHFGPLCLGEAFQKVLVIVMPVLLVFSALGSRESDVLKLLGQSPAMKSCFTSCLQPHC